MIVMLDHNVASLVYTLSLHDALPIWRGSGAGRHTFLGDDAGQRRFWNQQHLSIVDNVALRQAVKILRSEEHTSELQSRRDLVCRLLLETKKKPVARPVSRHFLPATFP